MPDRGFELDPFQVEAIDALDRNASVLVAAPTGAGKTVIAEHAVWRALHEGGKAFYTTPIKALSNQKYGDLVRVHGAERVGLLTGDNSINPDGDVVVMTTEVLRNMIYAGSPLLKGLRYVVLDEVHYLQDTYRGPVWEEVIIHLRPSVRLVCLSATVSNAEEVAEWLTAVRGATTLVLEEERPVELRNLYLVGDRSTETAHLLPTLVDGQPNPEAHRMDRASPQRRHHRYQRGARGRGRYFTPLRPDVIEQLGGREMLPALYFIFSRRGCDEAVRACVDEGLRLTSPEERRRVRVIAEERTGALSDDDLDVLRYDSWLYALEQGVAAHHAGMVPPFKETVEACFAEGLVKAVFATETLALGINMPARTVVIERLTKFTGEARAFLTPGEYTQITGRAGRRGIDDLGYAVVLWSPFVPFDQVASLASSRTYALRSAFRPTYNMAANLVRRYEPADAHHLLNLSFAQFQADRAVVRVESRIERTQQRIASLQDEATCERGDVAEYHRLRSIAGQQAATRREATNEAVEESLAGLVPGDVIGLSGVRLAVLSVAHRKGRAVKVKAIDPSGNDVTLGAASVEAPPSRLGRIDLPSPYAPNDKSFQSRVAGLLLDSGNGDGLRSRSDRGDGGSGNAQSERDDRPAAVTAIIAEDHPVASCPDRDRHIRALMSAQRAERDLAGLRREVRSRSESLARRFDRVLRLMEAWGYVDGDAWALSERGEILARTYHECDLLVTEAMCSGLLDDLDPATLAGLVSGFTYEHRGPGATAMPWFPTKLARKRWSRLEALHAELAADEDAAGLQPTRAPDPGFFVLAHAWAAGEPLAEVLADEDVSGGDFVRNIKTLVDLLRQVGDVAPAPGTARSARQAADALQRGVVIASSSFDADSEVEGTDVDGARSTGAAQPDGGQEGEGPS